LAEPPSYSYTPPLLEPLLPLEPELLPPPELEPLPASGAGSEPPSAGSVCPPSFEAEPSTSATPLSVRREPSPGPASAAICDEEEEAGIVLLALSCGPDPQLRARAATVEVEVISSHVRRRSFMADPDGTASEFL
jgi:hypothetical protein